MQSEGFGEGDVDMKGCPCFVVGKKTGEALEFSRTFLGFELNKGLHLGPKEIAMVGRLGCAPVTEVTGAVGADEYEVKMTRFCLHEGRVPMTGGRARGCDKSWALSRLPQPERKESGSSLISDGV